jgi:tRNA(Arg) A34 adenosine deaminase TadA
MELSWEAYRSGSVPIGAVVTDASGHIVAEARNRLTGASEPGQLGNSRVAHAELNALAQLPADGFPDYSGHAVFSNVEPCSLCMGAAIMTGVGTVHYGWADPYAGAASCMTIDNAQVRRRRPTVLGPSDPTVERLTVVLVFSHYVHVRPGLEHVLAVFGEADPLALAIAKDEVIKEMLEEAAREGTSLDDLARAISAHERFTGSEPSGSIAR